MLAVLLKLSIQEPYKTGRTNNNLILIQCMLVEIFLINHKNNDNMLIE
jgi:hypothetical protein